MDEKEKTYVSEIFKICRAMERMSRSYFNEQINKVEFFPMFSEQVSKLNALYDKRKDLLGD